MKLTFFTTTTYSDIQEYQSKLIKKYFPNSEHILIDGRTGWFSIWYEWLNRAKDMNSDYFIHIDEDCFIFDDKYILETIDKMKNENYDIAGPPDGCCEYRSANYMALNSFFMIVSKKAIKTWFNRTHIPQFKEEWIEEYPFEKENDYTFIYDMEFGTSNKPLNEIWKPCSEPYYDFMWVLKDNNIKFLYLEPKLSKDELKTTNLLNNSIIHMWHQRQRYNDNFKVHFWDISNKQRFDLMIEKIKKII